TLLASGGRIDAAAHIAGEMDSATNISSTEPAEAHTYALIAESLARSGNMTEARHAAKDPLSLAQVYDDRDHVTAALGWAAQALAITGDIKEALKLAKRVWIDGMWLSFRMRNVEEPSIARFVENLIFADAKPAAEIFLTKVSEHLDDSSKRSEIDPILAN